MGEYDSVHASHKCQVKDQMPKRPSEYYTTNVFVGGSYMASFEVKMAVADGYWPNVM
jgi:hypothetical protein